jgi:transposase
MKIKVSEKQAIKTLINFIYNSEHKHHFDFTYHTQKYSLEQTLPVILYVLKTGLAWEKCKDLKIAKNISYGTFYHTHKKLVKLDIYKANYRHILTKYYTKDKEKYLKKQTTDTTFILNKGGVDKIGFNKQIPKHKLSKLSTICDANGKTIDVNLVSGNIHGTKILQNQIKNFKLSDKYKHTSMADKEYDSEKIRKILKENGYKNIKILINKKNTKDPQKLERIALENKRISKDRSVIERTYAYIKSFKRLQLRYDKKSINYLGFIYFALSIDICR